MDEDEERQPVVWVFCPPCRRDPDNRCSVRVERNWRPGDRFRAAEVGEDCEGCGEDEWWEVEWAKEGRN